MINNLPSIAAINLFKAWSYDRSPEECFPVDCKKIAEELKLRVRFEKIDDNGFSGMLDVTQRLILCNENITSKGRKNFTIAHELGHYSLHKNK